MKKPKKPNLNTKNSFSTAGQKPANNVNSVSSTSKVNNTSKNNADVKNSDDKVRAKGSTGKEQVVSENSAKPLDKIKSVTERIATSITRDFGGKKLSEVLGSRLHIPQFSQDSKLYKAYKVFTAHPNMQQNSDFASTYVAAAGLKTAMQSSKTKVDNKSAEEKLNSFADRRQNHPATQFVPSENASDDLNTASVDAGLNTASHSSGKDSVATKFTTKKAQQHNSSITKTLSLKQIREIAGSLAFKPKEKPAESSEDITEIKVDKAPDALNLPPRTVAISQNISKDTATAVDSKDVSTTASINIPNSIKYISSQSGQVSYSLRERLMATKKQLRKLKMKKLGVVFGVLASVALVFAVIYGSSLFALSADGITVLTKTEHISEKDIKDTLADNVGVPLPRLSVENMQKQVQKSFVWAKKVSVTRQWPNSVAVSVTERTPVAVAKTDQGYVLLDADGVKLQKLSEPLKSVPLVSVPLEDGKTKDALDAILKVLDAIPNDLRQQITQADASSKDSITFSLASDQKIIWGANSDNALKSKVVALLMNKPSKIIDVSTPTKPVTTL